MTKAVRVSALALMGALLLAGAALASPDTPPAPPTPPSSPAQSDAVPPPPEAPVPAPPAAQTDEKDPLDEVVCKKDEAMVGSRLGSRKVCKTRRQWRDERDAAAAPDGSMAPKVNN